MGTPYVCLGCRSRLLLRTSLFGRQEIRCFSQSTRTRQNQDRNQGSGSGIGAYFGRGGGNENVTGRRDHGGHRDGGGNSDRDAGGGGGSLKGRYSGRELRPEQLLLLAQAETTQPNVSRRSNHHHHPHHPRDLGQSQSQSQRQRPTQELQKPLDLFLDRTSADDLDGAWSALCEIGKIGAQRPVDEVNALFSRSTNFVPSVARILSSCIEHWLKGLRDGNLHPNNPSPYQVLQVLHGLNNTRAQLFRPTLWHLADGICRIRFSEGGEDSLAVRQGREELVKIWRLCMGAHLTRKALGDRITDDNRSKFASISLQDDDWSFLPPIHLFTSETTHLQSSDMFADMLALLVPYTQRQRGDAADDYTSPAIVTWDLLQALPPVLWGSSPLFAPIATLFATIFKHASAPRVPMSIKRAMVSSKNPAIREGYRSMLARVNCEDLPAFMRTLTATQSAAKSTRGGPSNETTAEFQHTTKPETPSAMDPEVNFEVVPQNPETENFAITQLAILGRAMERDDIHAVEKVKRAVLDFARTHNNAEDSLPLEVFEHLMLAALSVRNAKLAIEIWDLLPQLGHKPTLKTYTVMMRGAQIARDVLGMEAFWHKMRQAGLKPDAHAWSIRVFTLLKLRRTAKAGLEALNQMGQEWLAAARAKAGQDVAAVKSKGKQQVATLTPSELIANFPGPIDGVPKPSLAIMNASIAGLSTSRPAEIPNVFSWGRSFGIEPDIFTYNALLTLAMRHSQSDGALNILRQMQQRGIQADSTTWTVLLSSLFENGFLDNLSHDEQEAKIIAFIESLSNKDLGLSGIDQKAYALLIDRLLKRYGNTSGAGAVFAHMIASGLEPSPHIYTILMTSYFQRQPEPDFAAIDNLWHRIQDLGQGFSGRVDTTFFDRMIEGYARHHHLVGPKPMEEFLAHARTSGKQPGWMALESVARVFAEREMWKKLRTLIDQVKISQRENSSRFHQTGQERFWSFISQTGILEAQGLKRGPHWREERGSPLTRALQGA